MRALFCILSFLFLVSCSSSHRAFKPDKNLEGIETILIMPFQSLYPVYGNKAHIDCDVFERRHTIGKVPEEASEFMTERLKNLLMDDRKYRFVFHDRPDAVPTHLQIDPNCVVRTAELIATTAGATDVDAILVGYIFHFRERVGTSYSVESPASVSFSLFLIRVTDGRIVWRAIFEETQQALSENILKIGTFIKRKARWITAREMAAEGLENLVSKFPKP